MANQNTQPHIATTKDFIGHVKKNIGGTIELPALEAGIKRFEEISGTDFQKSLQPELMRLAENADLTKLRNETKGWRYVELTRIAIASLLASFFVCSPSTREELDGNTQPSFRKFSTPEAFKKWFTSKQRENAEKVACMLCYFYSIALGKNSAYLSEKVTFSKRDTSLLGEVENPHRLLEELRVSSDRNHPELIQSNTAKIIFVESDYKIGKDLFSEESCFQEEIEMIVRPELMVVAFIYKGLGDGRAVVVSGARKYAGHSGFGVTFRCRWLQKCESSSPVVVLVKTCIVRNRTLMVYQKEEVKKYLNSAFAGLHALGTSIDTVAFEFWGWSDRNVPSDCPAKRTVVADPAVIIMVMWLAASMTFKKVLFRESLNVDLGMDVGKLSTAISHLSIVQGYKELLQYCTLMQGKQLPRNNQIKAAFRAVPGFQKIPVHSSGKIWNWLKAKMESSIVSHDGLKDIKAYHLKKVYKVRHYRLWERYLESRAEIRDCVRTENCEHLFHGTTKAEEIATNGFDVSFCSAGMLGKAIYFADLSSKSTQYTFQGFRGPCSGTGHPQVPQCNECVRSMLICRVMLGKSYPATKYMTKLTRAPENCHSVIAEPGNWESGRRRLQYRECAIYNNFQAFPGFIVEFTIET